jgi:RNA polymerase sigma-70 factor (ECF subfamily)
VSDQLRLRTARDQLRVRKQAGELDFDRAFREHAARLRAMVLNYTGDEDMADEVTQDTFVRALRYRDRIDAEAPMFPWLSRLAAHIVGDRLRTNRRRPFPVSLEFVTENERPPRYPDPNIDPAERLIAREGNLLWALRGRQRRALFLHYIHGYKHSEIAEGSGISLTAAKAVSDRARREVMRLHKRFKEGKPLPALLILSLRRAVSRVRHSMSRLRSLDAMSATTANGAIAFAVIASVFALAIVNVVTAGESAAGSVPRNAAIAARAWNVGAASSSARIKGPGRKSRADALMWSSHGVVSGPIGASVQAGPNSRGGDTRGIKITKTVDHLTGQSSDQDDLTLYCTAGPIMAAACVAYDRVSPFLGW